MNRPPASEESERIIWVLHWADRMYEKYGESPSHFDWIRRLAYLMGEEGNQIPSKEAIEVAKRWEREGVNQ